VLQYVPMGATVCCDHWPHAFASAVPLCDLPALLIWLVGIGFDSCFVLFSEYQYSAFYDNEYETKSTYVLLRIKRRTNHLHLAPLSSALASVEWTNFFFLVLVLTVDLLVF